MSTPSPALFCVELGCNRDRVPGSEQCVVHANAQKREPRPPATGFDEFMRGARDLVEGKAITKGYNEGGTERNDLMEFTNKFFPGHAGGEIVYKAIRYGRKRDKADLLKIAAWAYLLWRYDQ